MLLERNATNNNNVPTIPLLFICFFFLIYLQGPRIESSTPLYGPIAGGTVVNITVAGVPGYSIANITAVQVAGMPCSIHLMTSR